MTPPVDEVDVAEGRKQSPFWSNAKRLLKIPLAIFGFVIIFIVIICAFFAPLIAPHDPLKQDTDHLLEGPSQTYPLGTDQLGRDELSRIIYGSRVSLIVSIGAVVFGLLLGLPLGLISAYARGWVDDAIMRIVDGILALPSLVIAVGMIAAMGASLINVIIAIGVHNVPVMARIVRSQALSVRERQFVTASQVTGASAFRIISLHLWPNCTAPVIVQATLGMALAILVEAALGFIGVGVPPPTPTWGNMLQFAFALIEYEPLLVIWPGLAIFVLVLAFNFVGDALRDILDPRLRGLW